VDTVKIGKSDVSRFIIGGNPFSGSSSGRGREADKELPHYYTCARIKETYRQAESLGVTAAIARADAHILRVLTEYWDEGGTIQWLGQTCPELDTHERSLDRVAEAGGIGCHIHGGVADRMLDAGRIEDLIPIVAHGRKLGLAMGLAGHNPDTFRWAEEHLELDYYMCSYFRGPGRPAEGEPRREIDHDYIAATRNAMTDLIQTLSRPVIHYKVLAAGRSDPAEALAYVAQKLRPTDAVCVGIYTRYKPDMLREDLELLGFPGKSG
jgi:hypothetical protein